MKKVMRDFYFKQLVKASHEYVRLTNDKSDSCERELEKMEHYITECVLEYLGFEYDTDLNKYKRWDI